MKSVELRSQRAALVSEARAIVNKAEAEKRDLHEEERAAYETKMQDVDNLAQEIAKHERNEKLDHVEAELRQAQPRKVAAVAPSNSIVSERDRKESFRQWAIRGTPFADNSADMSVRASACGINLHSANMGNIESRALSVTSQGTDLVPTTLSQQINVALKYYSNVRNFAKTISTGTGNPLDWPTVDDTANVATKPGEAGGVTVNVDPSFSKVTFNAYKYHSDVVKVSYELLQDSSIDLEALLLGDLLPKRIARKEETDFVQGTGTTLPNGLINCCTASVALAGGNAITFAKLKALEHSLDPFYRSTAAFVMHDSTWSAIEQIADSTGRPIFLPGYAGLSDSSQKRLFGYPVYISNQIPNYSGNEGSTKPMILFGDFANSFMIRDVAQGFQLTRLNELYAANQQVGFQLWHRTDSNRIGPSTSMVSLTSV